MKYTILITGGTGMVGKAIRDVVNKEKYGHNFIYMSSKKCDLMDYKQTLKYFSRIKPYCVIHLAADVGGLFKNMKYKVEMFENNIIMNTNVLRCCHKLNINNVISCLSTCIFPDNVDYPITEDKLHNGPPHPSNETYAYAKRMLDIQSRAYREQYNRNYICIIPCNIYGKYDNFSLLDAHVIPALIHKCYLSKLDGIPFLVKGTGKPLRQFIYSEDLARLILKCVFSYEKKNNIILSVAEEDEVSIKHIAELICKNMNYYNIKFNSKYSDGQYKKTVSNKRLTDNIKDIIFTPIDKGIEIVCEWFIKNYRNVRK